MLAYAGTLALAAAAMLLGTTRGAAQEVHEIRMVSGKGEFRFEPASVSVRGGDVLLFRAVSGAPHSVVFEGKDLSAATRQQLNGALPRRAGDLSSPLLTDGAEYRVVVPALPAGTYRYFCLPHRAYDMRGQVTVK
jgi:plastocyanin